MDTKLIVGTRGSKLALIQTENVVSLLHKLHPSLIIETKIIKTTGDKIQDKALNKIGGKGLFIKEIEEALQNKEIDFAVHSAKDVPHTIPNGFQIGAILKRDDPRDILILKSFENIQSLPINSKIGTGSLRRKMQIQYLRPDLIIKPIRGNIDSRLKKLAIGEFDAIILAIAGLKRLGWQKNNEDIFFKTLFNNTGTSIKTEILEINSFIPSPGQGAILIEVRENDINTLNYIKSLNNKENEICILAERAFLKEINGGCDIPVGAYCNIIDNKINMIAFVGDEINNKFFKRSLSGTLNDYEILGQSLANKILQLKNENIEGT